MLADRWVEKKEQRSVGMLAQRTAVQWGGRRAAMLVGWKAVSMVVRTVETMGGSMVGTRVVS